MKILLINNVSHSIVTFRKSLISYFQNQGWEVSAIAFDDECESEIQKLGVKFFSINDKNRSLNPFKVLSLKKKYLKIIKGISPDIVFTFMMKPNIFGVRAAKKAGVKKIFAMVEGGGDVFINKGIKWGLIRSVVCKMYRRSFKIPNKIFFLNNDDKAEFISRKLVKENKCEVIYGIGIDLNYFSYKPIKNYRTFLMVARMLKTKGVLEYCQVARIVKQQHPDAVFNYLGGEGTVKIADIQEYIDDGSINYLGTTNDVRSYYEDCSALILPSYREGFPVCVMEAQATGRLAIVSDANGCRDAIKNGVSGFLIDYKNINSIVEKVVFLLDNPDVVDKMGNDGYRFAKENFDFNSKNEVIYNAVLK